MLKFIKITNKRHIDWIIATSLFKVRNSKVIKNGTGVVLYVTKDEFVAVLFRPDIYI